jgi:hypothetical protein
MDNALAMRMVERECDLSRYVQCCVERELDLATQPLS